MGSLRELIVSIDFDNVDMGILDRIERDVDDIEDALEEMGNEIDEVMAEFAEIAAVGSASFDEISSEAHSAASAIDEIGDEAQGAASGLAAMAAVGDGMLDGVESQADQTASALDEVGDQAGEASAAMGAMGATGSASMRELERAARDAAREVDNVGDQAEGSALKIGLITIAIGALTALGTAMGAPLIAGIMGIAASFGAAGIGAAAYGAVAVSVLGQVFESATKVDQIQEKIDNADSAKERIAAQKELAELYEGMSASQRGALQELQEFKSFWGDFTKQFENPIFDAFNQGLKLAQSMLTGLAPTIGNVSAVVTQLLEELNGFVSGGGLNSFFEWLSTTASSSLYNWSHIFGNTFNGIFGLLQAFTPLGKQMESGLLGITEKFSTWANTLSSNPAFQNFVEYVQTNGPVLWDTLGNIANIFGDIIKAAAPLGEIVLAAFEGITQKISELTPGLTDVVTTMIDAGTTIKDNWQGISTVFVSLAAGVGSFLLIMKGLQIISVINQLMVAWRAGTVMATLAQWGLNTAMLASPITWIVVAIAALIAIGVALWMNWDTVKAKAAELWAAISEAWSSLVEWTKETWNNIMTSIGEAWDAAVEWVSSGVESFVTGIATWWNQLVMDATTFWTFLTVVVQMLWSSLVSWVVETAMQIWTGLTNIWNMIVTTASVVWNLIVTTIVTVFTQLWAGIVAIATAIWTGITTVFTAIWTTAVTIWTAIVTAITTIFSTIWSYIVTIATAIWTTISTVFTNILTTAITIWTAVASAIQTFFTMAWNYVVQIATQIWTAITTTFNNVLNTARTIWTAVTSAIQSAFNAAVGIVTQIVTSIYNAIKSNFDTVKSVTTSVWNSVKDVISNAMDSAKTAVSNFFSPLFNFIDRAKGAWDGFVGAIKSFKMPSFKFPSLPSWMPGGGADGSHATGLAQVPFDGYKAILHKDEAVLTARQSNALREAGILGTTGSRPTLNLEKDSPSRGNGGGGGGNSSGTTFAPQVVIHVNSNGDASIAQQVKEETKKALRELWDELNLAT
ncbi:hypothetical protein V4C29_24195 [Bacillus cereus]|jgi:phage-related protein|uniref:phage tail protein n=1 Tax=Bacillus cereus TaxID=1396 RepID=UPI001928836E|nr:hypothetical protein [Bacillus cereus]MBL3768821.1 hypothetical protein [Bacillus cereus]HDR4393019.1 hypothetical protein [Bacillus cereus]